MSPSHSVVKVTEATAIKITGALPRTDTNPRRVSDGISLNFTQPPQFSTYPLLCCRWQRYTLLGARSWGRGIREIAECVPQWPWLRRLGTIARRGWRLTNRSRHSGIEPHNEDHSHDQRGGPERLAATRSTSDRRAFSAQDDLCVQRIVPTRRLRLAATGGIRDV